jgi:cell division protein FtsQ
MIKVFSLILIAVVIGFGVFFGVSRTDFLKISEIQIDGAAPKTEERLRSKLSSHIGQSFLNFSVAREMASLKQDPWVKDVEIHRVLPQKIAVHITERTPVALIGNGQGRFNYIDETNTVIDSNAEVSELTKYPALFGFTGKEKDSLREQALWLLKSLPPDGFVSHRDVSEISFDHERGFQITLAKTRLVVDLGKENLPVHLDRARKVVQYLDEHQIQASKVDSDYAKKVLVKVRKGR